MTGRNNWLAPKYYTYLILDASKLDELCKKIGLDLQFLFGLSNEDFLWFMSLIVYVGKGTRNRKFTHIEQVIKLLLKHGKRALSGPKALSIYEIWEKGGKVAVVQLGQDTSNFEAASNENAVITALGLKTLTKWIGAVIQ